MLGLIIGVASVILLTSFGQGVGDSVNAAIAPVANNITVVPKIVPTPGGPPTDADERAINKLPGVTQLEPEVTGAAGQNVVAVTASATTAHFTSASVIGTTSNFLAASQRAVTAGRFFSPTEEHAGAKVAVLGTLISRALYGLDPTRALGKTMRLNHVLFTGIGLVPSRGQ